ncbi:restriction endonuclease subunit S [uncultured Rothia sp.]|uniref:restriction endonuclease subunit S n=1 Tax=uncultured Rothia sp. TaxID=316088 RepID=UPI0028CFF61B|nr:restriction endonuclease subunit S [uncultured Rothia sp.]
MAEVTNYIDRLVAELCPDGVEYRPLESLGKRNKGTAITASKMRSLEPGNKDLRIFAAGSTFVDTDSSNIPAKDILHGPAIIVKSRGYIGFEYYEKSFTHKNEMWSYTLDSNIVNQKFIYYYLLTQAYYLQELARSKSVKLPQLSVKDTDSLEVPVPPLEIQEAIVEILDKFTNLEAELEAELEARTLQYEYYRNSLFETLKDPVNGLPVIANLVKELCPNGVKYSTLKSVSLKTTNIKWERSEEAEYRYIDLSSVPTGGSSIGDTEIINSENAPSRARQIVHTGDILFGTTRPLLDRVVIVPEEYDRQICSTGYAVIRPDTNVVIPSYIYHILREKNFSAYVEKNQTGAAYPAISFKSVMEYTIPLPPLEIQQRIVDILDRFDALTSSLSEGLPAELAARRSQYEYYRDQLLTFPRKGENQ